jgi:hypothetical protein
MIKGHLHLDASAEDTLMEGSEVRQRTDFEGGVLESGVSEDTRSTDASTGWLLRKALSPRSDVSVGTT